jgi:hypothetical protein
LPIADVCPDAIEAPDGLAVAGNFTSAGAGRTGPGELGTALGFASLGGSTICSFLQKV